MDKKDSIKGKEIKRSNYDLQKTKESSNRVKINDKRLPWWVELLFVQIGLPDKWLIKLLKTRKLLKELYLNEKRLIFTCLFIVFAIGYFQPVIKYSRNRLKCQKTAIDYFLTQKSLEKLKNSQLDMLAVNFCNGGIEVDNLDK
tara:strand:+ start:82 stop:510 length:429 start_codon:yes stop_codon:yes gene_type:complete